MPTATQRTAAVLAVLSLGYVALFVPPNATGSADANMLGAFELDEFAQYHALWRMTEPADSAGEALRRLVAYDYYTYGFPFFGTSAALFWPLRRAYTEAGEPGLTRASLVALRGTSALLNALSIVMLVGLWVGWREPARASALFVFLAALPAVVGDALWWHPDAWVTFFSVAALFGLARDRRRLGRGFYAAAVACGLATATKLVGVWFFAAVALHLWRAREGRSLARLAAHGAGFAAVMALATLAASPMLLVPGEAAKVWDALVGIHAILDFGVGVRGETGVAAWAPVLQGGFGWAPTLAAFVGLCAWTAARDPERRDVALATLAFAAPLVGYLVSAVAVPGERYLLAPVLPLAASVAAPLAWRPLRDAAAPRAVRVASAALACGLAVQLGFFVAEDARRWREKLAREETSAALAFAGRLEREVLAALPDGARLRILRDPYVYLPPDPHHEVHLRWGGFVPGDVREVDPDLLLLRRASLERGANERVVARSRDPERAARGRELYRAALRGALPGYRLLVADDFALAFGRAAPPPG